MEEYQLEDEQRERAVAYLEQEHARGVFDDAELARRTTEVRSARTVAQLLAATADPAVAALEPTPRAVPTRPLRPGRRAAGRGPGRGAARQRDPVPLRQATPGAQRLRRAMLAVSAVAKPTQPA